MRLFEIESATDIAVFYGGRFQPMHQGHYQLYQNLVSEFGADHVFIATMFGKKQREQHLVDDYSTDPFTFREKTKIMSVMFGIPDAAIVNTSPYRPDLSKIGKSPADTAVVLAFSDKDAGRLKPSRTLQPMPESRDQMKPLAFGVSYYVTMPSNMDSMSATDFRDAMASHEMSDQEKREVFKKFFGKFNQKLFDITKTRLM